MKNNTINTVVKKPNDDRIWRWRLHWISVFPGSAEADVRWGGNLNGHLMASHIRNTCTRNCQNLISLVQVIIDNVRDRFLTDTVHSMDAVNTQTQAIQSTGQDEMTFASVWRQCSTPDNVGSSENRAKPDTEDSLTPMDFSSATRNSDTVVEPSKLTT